MHPSVQPAKASLPKAVIVWSRGCPDARPAPRRDRCETMAVAAPIPVDFSAVECTEFFKLNESITFFVLLTSFILAVEYLVPPVRLGPNSGQ